MWICCWCSVALLLVQCGLISPRDFIWNRHRQTVGWFYQSSKVFKTIVGLTYNQLNGVHRAWDPHMGHQWCRLVGSTSLGLMGPGRAPLMRLIWVPHTHVGLNALVFSPNIKKVVRPILRPITNFLPTWLLPGGRKYIRISYKDFDFVWLSTFTFQSNQPNWVVELHILMFQSNRVTFLFLRKKKKSWLWPSAVVVL